MLYRDRRLRRRGTRTSPPDAAGIALALSTEDVGPILRALDELLAEGRVERDGAGFRLAEASAEHARRIATRTMATRFGEALVRADASAAYRELCRRVYELPFPHFGDADAIELERVIAAVGPVERALDLGCGTGAVTEHLAATLGGQWIGVDFATRPVARSAVTYEVADLDEYEPQGPLDAIVAMDTLYFPEDLPRLLAVCARALRPGGRLVAPCRVSVEDDEPLERLEPHASRFAEAMRAAGLAVAASDGTATAHATWRRTDVALRDLEEAFRAEGNRDLWIGRRRECDAVLGRHDAGRTRRWLYVATR